MPRRVLVRVGPHGDPVELAKLPGSRSGPAGRVARVEEVWRIAEEWWREDPLERTYYQLQLVDGRSVTLFHDTMQPSSGWYEQRY